MNIFHLNASKFRQKDIFNKSFKIFILEQLYKKISLSASDLVLKVLTFNEY